jgi:cytochrome P450
LRDIDDLPGPRGLPVLGNLHQIELGRVHQILENWAREYGRYFRFELGTRQFLVVADHEVVGAVLRDRPDGFRRTVRLENVAREMGLAPGLFGAEGEAWRHQRRMVMAGFDPAHIKAYFPSLMKVTQRLHGRWQKAARAGIEIDLQADLMRFTVDAIAGLAFGADVNTLESDEDVIQRHLDKIFPKLFSRAMSAVPYWRYVRLPADRQLDRSVAAVNLAIDGFIAQARERMRIDPSLREHPRNLLEAMIAAADLGGSGVSDREVAGNVMTMLLAGEDTTANSLAWMIYLLRRNPQTLQRAQDEVRRVLGGNAATGLEQMGALQYVEACAHETMRLKPVGPFLVFQALRDTVIGDVRVPADTLVWCLMRHDSVDESHFPDPAAFEPQRWLGEGGPSRAANAAKRVSMPFGAGPRLCPGRNLALLEMKMAMAMLLGRFEIESVETPDGGEAEEHLSFTMAPLGLRMRLRERAA